MIAFLIATAIAVAGQQPEWLNRTEALAGDFYPAKALRMHEEGTSAFTVEVDAAGQPSRCTMVVSSGFSDLDERACLLVLKRAYFRPATGAAGNAVAGRYAGQIVWKIDEIGAPKNN